MARIENFVPVLLSGRVESHGTNFINYQLSTGEVRNLPLGDHHLSLFKMLNGNYSLSEIIMNLFKTEEQPLNVGTLLNVLSMLGNQRMFKNNDDMMEAHKPPFLGGGLFLSNSQARESGEWIQFSSEIEMSDLKAQPHRFLHERRIPIASREWTFVVMAHNELGSLGQTINPRRILCSHLLALV